MFFKGRNGRTPPELRYHPITCMNLKCMKESRHGDRIFQLNPPGEVDDYRKRMYGASAQRAGLEPASFIPSASVTPARKDILADIGLSDDNGDEYAMRGIGNAVRDGGDYAEHAGDYAIADAKRLEEMARYYYSVPDDFAYEYGGGDRPNYIRIPQTQMVGDEGGAFPRPAYRKYYRGDIKTQYVSSIVDCYGNETKTAVCPYCRTPVYAMAGLYETFVFPVIGVSQSGKTVLLSESFSPFMGKTARHMLPMGFYSQDGEMREYLREISGLLRESGEIGSTLGVQRLSCELGGADRKIAVFTFDLPGEAIANERYREFREKELSNLLHRADGIIFIFCPEQIESISQFGNKYRNGIDDTRGASSSDRNGASSIKGFGDMIRLLANESDPADIIKTKNLPIAVVMTMMDLFRSHDGVNRKIDITRLPSGARKLLDDIYDRAEVSVLPERRDVVNVGEIERYAQRTKDFFMEIIPDELNMIMVKFAGNRYNVNCFAMSSQGYDAEDDVQGPPIRPNELFYWLFAKTGIYRKPEVSEGGARRKK